MLVGRGGACTTLEEPHSLKASTSSVSEAVEDSPSFLSISSDSLSKPMRISGKGLVSKKRLLQDSKPKAECATRVTPSLVDIGSNSYAARRDGEGTKGDGGNLHPQWLS